MFDDILKAVQDEYAQLSKELPPEDVAKFDTYLRLLYTYREKIEDSLYNITNNITQLKKTLATVPERVALVAIERGDINKRLLSNLEKAIKMNTEFDTPEFKGPLIEACGSPEIVAISTSDAGVHISIDLNVSAGSIEDWANAVRSIREKLRTEASKLMSTPEVASRAWKNLIYKPAREGGKVNTHYLNKKGKWRTKDITSENIAKYWDTIAARLAESGKLAPYWEIVDKGSFAMEGAGTAYPLNTATNFVGNTEVQMNALLSGRVRSQVSTIEKHIANMQKERETTRQALSDINAEIEKITYNASYASIPNAEANVQKFMDKIGNWVKQHSVQLSMQRVNEVITALRSGDITGLSITSEGRIELTPPGSPIRYRPVISDIISGFGI